MQANRLLTVATALLLSACGSSQTVPNPNSPGIGIATTDPRGTVQQLAIGVLSSDRTEFTNFTLGVANFGREGYNIFPTDSRTVTGWYRDFALNTSFSAADWTSRFNAMRTLNNLSIITKTNANFTAAEKAGADGFYKTEYALQLLYLVVTRNYLGIPVEVDTALGVLKPFVSRDSAYRSISALLDQGAASLATSGATFPFTLTSGYVTAVGDLSSPAGYLKLNRALQARVLIYRASIAKYVDPTTGNPAALYAQARAVIDSSFITPLTASNLNAGPQHLYSTASGDVSNQLFLQPSNAGEYIHPSLISDGTIDTTDNRYRAYVIQGGAVTPSGSDTALNVVGATNLKLNRFPAQTIGMPWVTNEELHLIKAEAAYFSGDAGTAYSELNTVHTVSGGFAAPLPAAVTSSDNAFITQLLTERRLSLLLLGHRWADVRRFGRLSTLPLSSTVGAARPFGLTANQVIPQAECLGRASTPAVACPVFTPNNNAAGL